MAQALIALALLGGIALLTWRTTTRGRPAHDGSANDVYLAGGGLKWLYVAGSITLTNLSTEQLVGMNGNQMLLLAWWELAGFCGLMILAFLFVPIYYRTRCTTVTELLEQRYGGGSIRTLISAIFLAGNVLIYLPAALYSGSLFLASLFGVHWPLWYFALPMALVAALYTITGGLRAVAVMDTYSGIGVLAIALLVVVLALQAVGWNLGGVPHERVSMIGGAQSPIPFHTLFTGMIFIQIFYWSTNQNITQKAMTAPSVAEAQKGVLAAAAVRIMVIPAIVALPGVAAYKLFGLAGDATYGRLVALVLPRWLAGAFAAMMAGAVIAHTAAILNSTVALYDVDFHSKFIRPVANHWRLSTIASALFTVAALAMLPVYEHATSIINLLQQLNGLSSMPILAAFVVALLFRGVAAGAAVAGVVWGVALYGLYTFLWHPEGQIGLHYIDFMVITLATSVVFALAFNRLVLGGRARFTGLAGLGVGDPA
ncbi:MAG: SLC5 family protein [Proteobacteria bacterium]|nr:SLC5 family protein [Pseudomonadota bacterium]